MHNFIIHSKSEVQPQYVVTNGDSNHFCASHSTENFQISIVQSSEHGAKRLGSLGCQRTQFTSVEWAWKGGIRSTNYQLWRGSSKDYHSGGVEITGRCRVSVSKLHTF